MKIKTHTTHQSGRFKGEAGFLAVIPARGGSSGLPGKNRMEVRGIGLVTRAVMIARRIEEIRWILVSTDDDEIAREAEKAGASVPFMRPPELSGGGVPMVEVLRHAVGWFRDVVAKPLEGVVLLQPTSPMRLSADVRGAMAFFRAAKKSDPRVAGVHTVSPVPERFMPPNLRRLNRGAQGVMRIGKAPFCLNEERVHSEPLYYRNGAAVVLDPDRLDALTLNQGRVLPYVMERPLVSIDTLHDLLLVEHAEGPLDPESWGNGRESSV